MVDKQYGFSIDIKKCINCGACTAACKDENNVEKGIRRVRPIVANEGVKGQEYTVPSVCVHCAIPLCVEVCPTGALQKRVDCIVSLDKDICIGCRYCMVACPFGVPQYSDKNGIMDKCAYCAHRIDAKDGRGPKCASVCPTGAITWGTMQELSEATQTRGVLKFKNDA